VRLWDADTGQPIGQPLTGHTSAVFSVAFSPDGHRIVSGSSDNTVRLWDAETGQPIGQPLTGHTEAVNSVAFSPDGHRIVSASADKTVRLWPTYADPASAMCAKLTTNMSHQQWQDWVSPDIDYIKACPDLPIPPDAPAH
jgi:WD40 repeat protein